MSDIREEMASIVRAGTIEKETSAVKAYYYPNIPEKIMKGMIKGISKDIGINSVVAFFDVSLLGNGTSGMVFTTTGMYCKDAFVKKIYFNYKDVTNIYFDIYIKVDIGEKTYDISSVCFHELRVIGLINRLKSYAEEKELGSNMTSGVIKKDKIPKEKLDKCKKIIHGASAACGGVGAGLAQLPGSDNAAIMPIQIAMIVSLGKVFELNIAEAGAKSIIESASASLVGRTISQILVGWIPLIGNAINTATAAGLTEAIGWIAVKDFYNRWLEDKNKGRLEGMKAGYAEASDEYEQKLRELAEDFLKQKKDFMKERDEYEALLNDIEEYIGQLEGKNCDSTNIREIKNVYEELKELSSQ